MAKSMKEFLGKYFSGLLELDGTRKAVDWKTTGEAAGMAIFAATVCLSISLAEIGLGIAAACRCLRFNRESCSSGWRQLRSGALFRTWAFYLAAGLLAALFAFDPVTGLKYLPSDLLKAGAFFLIVDHFAGKERPHLLGVYLAGALAAAALGLAQVSAGWSLRAHGTLHPVTYAEVLFFPFALSLCGGVFSKEKQTRQLLLLAGTFLLTAIIASQTRGALLGSAMFFLCAIFLSSEFRKKTVILALLILGGTVCSMFLSADTARRLRSIPTSVRDAVVSVAHTDDTTLRGMQSSDGSTGSRIALWHVGKKIWMDNFWLGVGPSNLKLVYDNYNPYPIEGQRNWSNVHNLYLQQAAERGVVGLCALLCLFAAFWRKAYVRWKASGAYLSLCAAAALPAFILMNFTETSFQHALPAFSVFIILAAAHSSAKNG